MTKAARSYNQYCPLARTLDVLGERWTLLIVRELLSGPKRFKDLQDALLGIGTNLLSARLKDMERNGIVFRSRLPPPGVAWVYELTEHGRRLDETLLAMIRWGIPLLEQPKKESDYFLPHWLLHCMLSGFRPALAQGVKEVYEFHVNDEVFHTRIDDGKASGDMGRAYQPDLLWQSDSEQFMSLVFRVLAPEEAVARGMVKTGNAEILARAVSLFDPFSRDPV